MSKRIIISSSRVDHIHFNKDSAGPERFVVTIDVDSMKDIIRLKSQLLKENDNYSKLTQIKERLEHVIKDNQNTQKSTKNKLDKMDDIQIKDENAEIDDRLYNTLEDYLDELAVDEQELLSILNNPKNEI